MPLALILEKSISFLLPNYDYAEGYLADEKGNEFFVEGEVQDDKVWIESPGKSETYEVYIDEH